MRKGSLNPREVHGASVVKRRQAAVQAHPARGCAESRPTPLEAFRDALGKMQVPWWQGAPGRAAPWLGGSQSGVERDQHH